MYRLQTVQQTDSHGDTFMTINVIDEHAKVIFQTFPCYDKEDFQHYKFLAEKVILLNNLFPDIVVTLEIVEECLSNKQRNYKKKFVRKKVSELLAKIKC